MGRGLLLTAVVATSAVAGEPSSAQEPFTIDSGHALKISVSHLFERSVARTRIGYLLAYWSDRFGVRSEWHGDRVYLTGRVWGMEVRATFDVQDRMVFAMAHDPGTPAVSAARDYVYRKLRKYLHPTYDEP